MLGAFVRAMGVSALETILPVAVVPACVLRVVLARVKAVKRERIEAARAAEAQRRAKKRWATRAGRGMGIAAPGAPMGAGPRRVKRPAQSVRREREQVASMGGF
ncbi:hypothetical protein [Polyangium aurulentum]|uniref:hypothetical protein n=1 Tax=Polyangium aurulentum TaxID=2567896 RepID=UPI0010ADD918|nr:hypothetical protein [Polyangium aurulentum]UQA60249.1 hypothetical protein E8A73_007160 [Polyangium aurulentum]